MPVRAEVTASAGRAEAGGQGTGDHRRRRVHRSRGCSGHGNPATARGEKDRAAPTPGGRRLQLPTSGKVFRCCSRSRPGTPSGAVLADTRPGRGGAGAEMRAWLLGQPPGLLRSAGPSARCPPFPPAPLPRRGLEAAVLSPPRPLPGLAVSRSGSPTPELPVFRAPLRPARPRPLQARPRLPENESPAAVSKSPVKVARQVPSRLMVPSAPRAAPRRRWVGARAEGGRELCLQGGEKRVNSQNQNQTLRVPTVAEVSTPAAPGAGGGKGPGSPCPVAGPAEAGAAARGSGGRARGAKIRPPCRRLRWLGSSSWARDPSLRRRGARGRGRGRGRARPARRLCAGRRASPRAAARRWPSLRRLRAGLLLPD